MGLLSYELIGPVNPFACEVRFHMDFKTKQKSGMFLAMAYERLWFRAFDPALREAEPPHPQCFAAAALARSPVRCSGYACPATSRRAGRLPELLAERGGCAATDAARLTAAPANWIFTDAGVGRCLARGCNVSTFDVAAMGTRLYHEWRLAEAEAAEGEGPPSLARVASEEEGAETLEARGTQPAEVGRSTLGST